VNLEIKRADGKIELVPLVVRIDTPSRSITTSTAHPPLRPAPDRQEAA